MDEELAEVVDQVLAVSRDTGQRPAVQQPGLTGESALRGTHLHRRSSELTTLAATVGMDQVTLGHLTLYMQAHGAVHTAMPRARRRAASLRPAASGHTPRQLMPVNTRHVNAPPEDVFEVLLDAVAYGSWVVGPSRVVSVDDSWPAIGSSFVHQHGRGALRIRDETTLVALEPGRSVLLEFNLRQLGVRGEVSIVLEPEEGGTRVVMEEAVSGGYIGKRWNSFLDRMLWARNIQALQRLKDLVEHRSDRPDSSPDALPTSRSALHVATGSVTALTFWTLSNLRRARAFHPVGSVHSATLEVSPEADAAGADFLRATGTYRARVRLSRAIGLPPALPDIFGLAVKVADRYGAGADQDLLLATSARGTLGRRLLVLRRDPVGAWYSSILTYRAGSTEFLFGAQRDEDAPDRIELFVATPSGPWRTFAALELGEAIDEATTFDPWNTGPDLIPSGLLNELRAPAYQGSRRGRFESCASPDELTA